MNISDISFIIHLRKDTEERKINADIIIAYYTNILPEATIIIVEDDSNKNFEYLQNAYKNIIYIHHINSKSYNKCNGYNIGLKRATTSVVCFLDIDCIISKENILKAIQTVKDKNSINIGYNGVSVYFKYSAKNKIKYIQGEELYNALSNFVDRDNLVNNFETEHYHIGNVKAVGGAVFGRKDMFEEIGGFNPNFVGWGYEDNEIITRAHKLGISVFYTNTTKPFLFHLPHIQTDREQVKQHSNFNTNEQEYIKILSYNTEQLQQYIKSWK